MKEVTNFLKTNQGSIPLGHEFGVGIFSKVRRRPMMCSPLSVRVISCLLRIKWEKPEWCVMNLNLAGELTRTAPGFSRQYWLFKRLQMNTSWEAAWGYACFSISSECCLSHKVKQTRKQIIPLPRVEEPCSYLLPEPRYRFPRFESEKAA